MASAEAVPKRVVDWTGKYELTTSDKLDEYLIAEGLPWFVRKMVAVGYETQHIAHDTDSDVMLIQTEMTSRTTFAVRFKIGGEPVTYLDFNKKKVEARFTREFEEMKDSSGKTVRVEKIVRDMNFLETAGKHRVYERYFLDGKPFVRMVNATDDVVCVRHFEKTADKPTISLFASDEMFAGIQSETESSVE